MDDKDIQSAFAHLLEAVADRVADQAAKRARGELSESEFVNSVLRTVQSIAPDAELPLKPGEFIAPEPPPAAAPDDDPGPDAVLAPLLDDEMDDDGPGILGWILERSARDEDGRGGSEDGEGEESDRTTGGAPAPVAAMDEPQPEPQRNFDARQPEPQDAAGRSASQREPSATPYEERRDAPGAATAMGEDAPPEAGAPAAAMDETFSPESGDGSLWDLEDAYTGGPAPEPGPEPGEPAPSAFALEDEPKWDVPAEAPDRAAPAPETGKGDGAAHAAMAGASHGAAPVDAGPLLDDQPEALPWEGPAFEPEPDLTEPAPALAGPDSPQAAQAGPFDAGDGEPFPAPEAGATATAPEPCGPDAESRGTDAQPVDDGMPVPDLDMADAGIEVQPPDEAEPPYGIAATGAAEPPYAAEPLCEEEPPADDTTWPGADADDEPVFQAALSDVDIAPRETAQDEEDVSGASWPGREIQDVAAPPDEDGHSAPPAATAQDDALDSGAGWSGGEQPLDEDAQDGMPGDEPPPLLLEDVVDAHRPPKPPGAPDDAPAPGSASRADTPDAPARPQEAVVGPQDGPASEPQAAPDAPRHAPDPFAFEDAAQGIDGILTKAARRAPALPAEPLPGVEASGPDAPETHWADPQEPGMDMLDEQPPGPGTPDTAGSAAQPFEPLSRDFDAQEADGFEDDVRHADTPHGAPPAEPTPTAPAMGEESDVGGPAPWPAPQADAYAPDPEMKPGQQADFAATTLHDEAAPSPGDEDRDAPEGPVLVDQEWEPDEGDPFADLPAPPDESEVWRPAPEACAGPAPEPRTTPQEGPAQGPAPDEGGDPFAGLPLPPDSPLAGQPPRAEAATGPAPAPEDIPSRADAATAAAVAAAAPPPPETAPRREGPRIYTPKPRGAAPAADDAPARPGSPAAAPSAHRPRVIVSGSAQWENDDSHELEDTMFRLGVDEDLAHDILAPSNDMAQRDRDFITKETRRALKEGGTLKNPSTAFLISLVLPGFGSVYAGSPLGIVFALPALALGIFFGLGQVQLEHALTGAVVLSVISALTAYINASEHNRRIRIREAQQPLRQEKRETTLRIK